MTLDSDDRWAIAETISSHGHLFDEGQLERLDELFTADVVYDVSDVGFGVLRGIDEIRQAAVELGAGNPLAHHVTNLIVTGVDGDEVSTRCKAIVVLEDGRAGTATYADSVRREGDRWLICRRTVLARRDPLGGVR